METLQRDTPRMAHWNLILNPHRSRDLIEAKPEVNVRGMVINFKIIYRSSSYWCSLGEWMGCWGNGIIMNDYEMQHSLIPDLKHQ